MRKEIKTGLKEAALIAGAVLIAKTASPDAAVAQKSTIENNLKATSIEQVDETAESREPIIGEAWHYPYETFIDTFDNIGYGKAIAELYKKGIVEGYKTQTLNETILEFRPNAPLKRAQFSKMIVLAFNIPVSEEDKPIFKDVENSGPNSFYPDNFIGAIAKLGLVEGKNSEEFAPYENLTLEQAVSILVRGLDNLYPGVLEEVPINYESIYNDQNDPHTENLRKAEYNGLFNDFRDIDRQEYRKDARRLFAAQLVFNSLEKIEKFSSPQK